MHVMVTEPVPTTSHAEHPTNQIRYTRMGRRQPQHAVLRLRMPLHSFSRLCPTGAMSSAADPSPKAHSRLISSPQASRGDVAWQGLRTAPSASPPEDAQQGRPSGAPVQYPQGMLGSVQEPQARLWFSTHRPLGQTAKA